MTIVKQTKLSLSALALLAISALPITTYAYDNLRIEVYFDDGRIEVDVDYDERGREVELEYVFNTTDHDEAYALTADRLDISISEVEDAVVRIDRDGDWDDDDRDDDDRWEDGDDYRRDGVRDDSYYRGSNRGDAQSSIADAEYEIAEATRFVNRNPNNRSAATDLERARELLADAESAYADREYGRAERLADEAEYLAEDIVRGRSSNSSATSASETVQSSTNSTDREALQRQLLALLQQLVQLLQMQSR
jgi:hypothetical protein